MESCDVTGIK